MDLVKDGDWFHHIVEEKRRRINQNKSEVINHLNGAK